MSNTEFWQWFTKAASSFEVTRDARACVDQIHAALMRIDKGLAVEVSEPDSRGVKEVIISANGVVPLFPLVEGLVSCAPNFPNWRFIALRPPRGFAFVFRQHGLELRPKDWKFLPLRDDEGNLGLQVFVPGPRVTISDTVLQTIIETGIGEKGFAEVHHVEYMQSLDAMGSRSWLGMDS